MSVVSVANDCGQMMEVDDMKYMAHVLVEFDAEDDDKAEELANVIAIKSTIHLWEHDGMEGIKFTVDEIRPLDPVN